MYVPDWHCSCMQNYSNQRWWNIESPYCLLYILLNRFTHQNISLIAYSWQSMSDHNTVPSIYNGIGYNEKSVILNRLFTPSWRGVLDTTLCDKVWQWLATARWFSLGTTGSPTNKTDHHDTTVKLLKVLLSTINQTNQPLSVWLFEAW